MLEGIVKPFPMAVHAGLPDRFLHIFGRMQSGCALLAFSVAGDAVDIRGIHQARRVRDSKPSASAVKFARPLMDLLAMAPIANRGGMDGGKNRTDLMPNMGVAIGALNLMVRHMVLMHELRGIFRRQNFRLIMALDAFSFWNVTVPLNHMNVTPLTGNPSGNILPVIEIRAFYFDVSFGFNMAGGASSNGAGNALLLSLRASLIVMTDETIDLMNGEVRPLDELGMAGGAPEFHPSS